MDDSLRGEQSQLTTFLRALRRRWLLFAVCVILAPLAAVLTTRAGEERYEASASLLFRDPGFDDQILGNQSLQSFSDERREAATNLELVSLKAVAARAGRELGLTTREIQNAVTIESDADSNVVNITTDRGDAQSAAEIANAVATEYIAFRRDADRSKILQARRLIDSKVASLSPTEDRERLRELRTRAERLDVLASLQTGNAEIVQRAEVPSRPVPRGTVRKGLLALIVGGLLGLGILLLVERLDRRLHSIDDVSDVFELPVLGTIGLRRGSKARQALSSPQSLHTPEVESFRLLRANLRYFNVTREIKSVLVTSSMVGEGKSTVSWNLALAAVSTGAKALLIEADLRHPVIGERLGIHHPRGLSSYLPGNVGLREAITTVPVGESEEGPTLDLLLSGPVPPNPADLVESDAMADLVRFAEENYDLVVIDTPPATIVSDAIPLTKLASGVILVSRIGRTTRDAAQKLRRQLHNVGAPVLGVVVNGVPVAEQDDTYGYAYGYTEPRPKDETSTPSGVAS
jgi:receptor protein-tyrosine kinase